MMHYILFVFFCSVHTMHAFFEHDRAAYALQVGEPEKAHALMTQLMVHNPDDAYKIYDAGVAAYKAQQYEYARSCFDAVAALPDAPDLLREQAYFNLGNTYVAQQNLDAAITSYEKTLAINADNAQAQHNLEIVKKMKQQQQESEKQSQQKEQEQQKEQSEKNKGSNQQDNEQRKQQGESQKQSQSDKEEKSQQEQSSHKNAADQQNPKKQKHNAEQKSQKDNGSQSADQQPKQGDNEHQQSSSEKQESASQSNKSAHNAKSDAKKNSPEKQKAQEQNQAVDQWVMNLLKEDEHNDAQLNKQIIKTTVGKELAGHHGQQCW